MRIKKVINNNILCVVDEKGGEMIVTGRGLGFQRKTGERVDPALVEKSYRMEGKPEQRKLRELCEQIPLEHLRLTQELIEYVKGEITSPINPPPGCRFAARCPHATEACRQPQKQEEVSPGHFVTCCRVHEL